MNNIIYRVVFKVGYYERWFDFDNATDATFFATLILNHETSSEDHKKREGEVIIKVVDKAKEETEKEDE